MGLREDGLRVYGYWETLAHFIRIGWEDAEGKYNWAKSEEIIKGLAERGFNLYVTQFQKGYGFEAEARAREDTREVANLCHKHGMYVGGYLRWSTFVPETLKQEMPDCVERFATKTIYGQPSRYGASYWRFMPCPSSVEFLEYMEKHIAVAVEDIKVDAIFVDGIALRLEPFTCHCPRCYDGFREWLNNRYPTAEEQYKRFGFSGFDHVELPDARFGPVQVWVPAKLREPIAQEWMFFRCSLLAKLWKFIVDAAHKRNPECFVVGNTSLYPHLNVGSYSAVELQQIIHCGSDGLFTEEHEFNAAHLSDDDRLQGYFESGKKLRKYGKFMFAYNRPAMWDNAAFPMEARRRSMAHQMAFANDATGVYVPDGFKVGEWPQVDVSYHQFHRDNRELFHKTLPAHDVAMYYSDRTRALNCGTPIISNHLALDVLMRSHVPFGYVMAGDHSFISDYKAIILPEIECMSVDEVDTIVRYVNDGGGLVVVGANTGRLSELGLLHKKVISAALGLEWNASTAAFTARVGKGRVAFVPVLVAPEGTPTELAAKMSYTLPYYEVKPNTWHPPRNGDDLLNALKWVSRGFTFDILAPRTVMAEFAVQDKSGRYLVHLVNFDLKNDVGPFEIITNGLGKVKKVEVFSPDDPVPQAEVYDGDEPGQHAVGVEGFARYIVLAIDAKGPGK